MRFIKSLDFAPGWAILLKVNVIKVFPPHFSETSIYICRQVCWSVTVFQLQLKVFWDVQYSFRSFLGIFRFLRLMENTVRVTQSEVSEILIAPREVFRTQQHMIHHLRVYRIWAKLESQISVVSCQRNKLRTHISGLVLVPFALILLACRAEFLWPLQALAQDAGRSGKNRI